MNQTLIHEQFEELNLRFSGLNLQKNGDGPWLVQGNLSFSAEYTGRRIDDEYFIEIILPEDYPDSPPKARETAKRIPADFHKYQDETLCLSTSLAVRVKFAQEPTLVGFVNNCLIPYLFSFSYKCKYGNMPFGELSHGGRGILEYYKDLFHLNDDRAVLRLIKILADDNYRGHVSCPCGSGKRLRACHGTGLLEIKKVQASLDFQNDYRYLIKTLIEN